MKRIRVVDKTLLKKLGYNPKDFTKRLNGENCTNIDFLHRSGKVLSIYY